MKSKPNIIYIFCDELRVDALQCYGNSYTEVQTPNIDWIAENGVKFNRCYCNSPVCVPSRTSIMTGLYPEDTGVYHNEAAWKNFRLDKDYLTFPEVLEGNGYVTANFGKQHLPLEMNPFMVHNPEGGDGSWGKQMKDKVNLITPGGPFTLLGGKYPDDINEYPPDKVTENALKFMKETNEPYFIRISYLQPHTPVFPKEPFASMYLKSRFRGNSFSHDDISNFEKRFAEVVDMSKMTEEEIHLTKVYYYGLVAWVDEQVGEIMTLLDKNNQLDNTIIIFGADHGASLGENGCYSKHIFAPQSHRVPLLISYKGVLPEGSEVDLICENLDLAKTIFGLTGIDAPKQFRGRDLFNDEPVDEVYSTIGFGHKSSSAYPNIKYGTYYGEKGWPRRACIRTDRYRLDKNIRIDDQPVTKEDEDIFFTDINIYPNENKNLVKDCRYKEVINELLHKLNRHVELSVEPDENMCLR